MTELSRENSQQLKTAIIAKKLHGISLINVINIPMAFPIAFLQIFSTNQKILFLFFSQI